MRENRTQGSARGPPGNGRSYLNGLTEKSALRESLNRALLEVTGSPSWQETLREYLGDL